MAVAVEHAVEVGGGIVAVDLREADRDEANAVGPDSPGGGQLGAQVDIVGQRVGCRHVQVHQHELMAVGDGGRIFRAQDRAGVALDQIPGAAEVPAGVAVGLHGLRRGQRRGGDGGLRVLAAGGGILAGRLRIPIAVSHRSLGGVADQAADHAGPRDRARGVAVGDACAVKGGADQPAHIGLAGHGADGVAVADRRGAVKGNGLTDQTAHILLAGDGRGGIAAVDDRAAAHLADQPAHGGVSAGRAGGPAVDHSARVGQRAD